MNAEATAFRSLFHSFKQLQNDVFTEKLEMQLEEKVTLEEQQMAEVGEGRRQRHL